jgi:MFS family permease
LRGTSRRWTSPGAIQGIGGAALFATALALIGAGYSGPARGRAIAIWGPTVGLAVASGGSLAAAFLVQRSAATAPAPVPGVAAEPER